jgi:phosphoglycolate phosphatase-like HAD superfamily hydrolase
MYEPYGKEIVNMVNDFHFFGEGGKSRTKKFKYFHKIFLKRDISSDELDLFCNEFSKLVKNLVINCEEIPGAYKFIEKSKINNKKIFVNSATPQNEMKEIVESRSINQFFTDIYGSPNSKLKNLEDISCRYNLRLDDAIFFGDLMSDYYAAEVAGCDFVGIGERFDFDEIKKTSSINYAFIKNFEELLI